MKKTNKVLIAILMIAMIFPFACKETNKSDSSDKMSKKDSIINVTYKNNEKDENLNKSLDKSVNDTNSGLYRGIYFFEDDGAYEKMDIDPIILVNDTCSYLLFCGVLVKDFSIKNDLISFGNAEYPDLIYIGEGTIEDDGEYGEIIIKPGHTANGMVKKVSGITNVEMDKLNNAIKQEQEFMSFWKIFIEAINTDNVELITEYVNFPFEDRYGRVSPNKTFPRTYDAKNKNEFIKNYSYMFRNDVKNFLKAEFPQKLYNEEVYSLDVTDFRILNFEKINEKWKFTHFGYLP
ncbi:MAG TPA: hypothetical protein VIL99_17490 [Ignavibacteria bacterium]